jgi:hypothetical protein
MTLQIFAVPKSARRAKPFVDHVTSFSVADGKVWFRNYQIVNDSAVDLDISDEKLAEEAQKASKRAAKKGPIDPLEKMSLNEIGPRFVLVPVKIFEGSFGGAVVWENDGASDLYTSHSTLSFFADLSTYLAFLHYSLHRTISQTTTSKDCEGNRIQTAQRARRRNQGQEGVPHRTGSCRQDQEWRCCYRALQGVRLDLLLTFLSHLSSLLLLSLYLQRAFLAQAA